MFISPRGVISYVPMSESDRAMYVSLLMWIRSACKHHSKTGKTNNLNINHYRARNAAIKLTTKNPYCVILENLNIYICKTYVV